MHISHVRNEGTHLLEAIDELLTIARHSGAPAEIWHLKAAGPATGTSWTRRSSALRLLAPKDFASPRHVHVQRLCLGLDATMPGWSRKAATAPGHAHARPVHSRATQTRAGPGRRRSAKRVPGRHKILLTGFRTRALKPLTGKSLAEVAALRGTSPEDTIMDLVVEDDSRVGCVFFTMSEDNVRKPLARHG